MVTHHLTLRHFLHDELMPACINCEVLVIVLNCLVYCPHIMMCMSHNVLRNDHCRGSNVVAYLCGIVLAMSV
jgi:Pyruvate/2-oxoacid:ferredoxin oxidoreductase delta subunit